MERVYYRKLIRDGVLRKMERNRVCFEAYTLDHERFIEELLKKAGEEASAFPEAGKKSKQALIDEIADLEDVLTEIKNQFAISDEDVQRARVGNAVEKRGFALRTFLVWSQKEGYTSNEKTGS